MRNIDICKAYFIFSVAIAHCPISPNASIGNNPFINSLWNSLGTIGVIGFLFFSGFFYADKKRTLKYLVSNKTRTIIIPWLVCGSAVFLASSLLGTEKSALDNIFTKYTNFIIGNGSLYYFLSMLILFFIFFNFIEKSRIIILATLFISPISIALFQYGEHNILVNPYLNPFNWISFFAAGVFVKKHMTSDLRLIMEIMQKHKFIIAIAFMASLFMSSIYDKSTYFDFINIFTEVSGVATVIVLSNNINSNMLVDVGKLSFPIYLLHIPLAGLINMVFYNQPLILFQILKPFSVILIMFALVKMYMYVVNKITSSGVSNFLCGIIGIREK